MSNSEVSINWASEAAAPLSSWADEMDELDALEPIQLTPVSHYDDSQPGESPLASSSSSSSDNEEKSCPQDARSTDRSPPLRDSSDRLPRSGSNQSLNRSGNFSRNRRSSLVDSNGAPRLSVKEQIPFPTVAPFVAFISNVHTDATRDDITKLFRPASGAIKSVKIILDKETGRPRGFCYVEFEDASGLRAAIECDGQDLMTQTLHIVVAEQKKEKFRSNSFAGLRDSGRRDSSDHSTGKHHRFDHQDHKSHKMDSPSVSSKGKFETPATYKLRKDDFKTQPRSNSFSMDKRASNFKTPTKFNSGDASSFREKGYKKTTLTITTQFGNERKVEEKPVATFGNMFSALQLSDDM